MAHAHARSIVSIVVGAGLALGGASLARADGPVFLYTLQDNAEYAQGCFSNGQAIPQCQCPIFLASSFTGTFGVENGPGVFPIVNIQWTASLQGNIAITGSGTYQVGTDQQGQPVQQMVLDLLFDGEGPFTFDSGLVAGGDPSFPPAITISIGDGNFCIGRRMTVDATPSAGSPADVAPAGGDGLVDVLDFLAVLSDWGLAGPRATDIDGSGTVDVADLLAVLANWTL